MQGLTTALTILLGFAVAASVLSLVALLNRIGVADDSIDGTFGGDLVRRARDADSFVVLTSFLTAALWVAIAVLTIIWTWRALMNHEALGRGQSRWTPRWGVAGWLVPFVNLVVPVLIFQDLWRGSDVRADPGPATRRAGSALVGWWWATWLLSGGIGWFATYGTDTLNAREVRDADTITALGSLITMVAALLFICVLRRITARQQLGRISLWAGASRGRAAASDPSDHAGPSRPPSADQGTARIEPSRERSASRRARRRTWIGAAASVASVLIGAGTVVVLTLDGDESSRTRDARTSSSPTTADRFPAVPEDFFVDLPAGFSYGMPFAESELVALDLIAGRPVQGPAGQRAKVMVTSCIPVDADACVTTTSPLTPITVEGERAFRYQLDDAAGVVWKPGTFELIVLSDDPEFADDLLTILVRLSRSSSQSRTVELSRESALSS